VTLEDLNTGDVVPGDNFTFLESSINFTARLTANRQYSLDVTAFTINGQIVSSKIISKCVCEPI
jgi:hypothetical protein